MEYPKINLIEDIRKNTGNTLIAYLKRYKIENDYQYYHDVVERLRNGRGQKALSGTPIYGFLKNLEKDLKINLSKYGVVYYVIEERPK